MASERRSNVLSTRTTNAVRGNHQTSGISKNSANLGKRPTAGRARYGWQSRGNTYESNDDETMVDAFGLESTLNQDDFFRKPRQTNTRYTDTLHDNALVTNNRSSCPSLSGDSSNDSVYSLLSAATESPGGEAGDMNDHAPSECLISQSAEVFSQTSNWSGLVTSMSFTEHLLSTDFLCSLGQLGPLLPLGPSVQLEGFLKPIPWNIGAEEAMLLQSKGALTLPEITLQNALLEAFIDHVYPHLPIVNLHSFLRSIQNRDGTEGQISLLLYHGVMFAASTFVNEGYLINAGYLSRKDAQDALYRRTRSLYDFDYESDRGTVIQVLLLMTYWHRTDNDQKDSWYWMGAAISLALSINLHLASSTAGLEPSERNLWRRVWWSCFVQERLMALGTKRPTRIRDECCDTPLLTVKDFEVEILPKTMDLISNKCKTIRAIKLQEDLASIFISKAQLCRCMNDVLQAPGHCLSQTPDAPSSVDPLDADKIQELDQKLMAWEESLPPSCQYRTITTMDIQNGRTPIVVQRTLLHMVYYSTVSMLHRAQSLPSSSFTHWAAGPSSVQHMSRLRVRESAMRITRMADELHQFALVRLLPSTSVATLLSAVVIHILEIKGQDQASSSRTRTVEWLRQCMRVMEDLGRIHTNAEDAIRYLNSVLDKTSFGGGEDIYGAPQENECDRESRYR